MFHNQDNLLILGTKIQIHNSKFFLKILKFEIFLKVKNELYENDQTELEIKMGKRTSMQNMNCSLDGSIDEPLENQVGLGINASRMSITTQLVMFKFDSLHASFVH